MISVGRDCTDLLVPPSALGSLHMLPGFSSMVVGGGPNTSCQLFTQELPAPGGSWRFTWSLPGISWAQEISLHATPMLPPTLEHFCASASARDRSSSQKPPLLPPPQPKPWPFLGHVHRLPISPEMYSVDSTLVLSCSVQTGQSLLSKV